MLCSSLSGKFSIAKEKPKQILSDERSQVLRNHTQKSSMLEITVCDRYKITWQCVLKTRGNPSQTRACCNQILARAAKEIMKKEVKQAVNRLGRHVAKKSFGTKLERKHVRKRVRIHLSKSWYSQAFLSVRYELESDSYIYVPRVSRRKYQKTWFFLPVQVQFLVAGILPVLQGFDAQDTHKLVRKTISNTSAGFKYGHASRRAFWEKELLKKRLRLTQKRLCDQILRELIEH